MTSEEERSEAGDAGAVCRSSASSAVPEEMPVTDLNLKPSEATVCDSADDTACEDSWRVNIETLPDEILVKIFSHLSFTELIDVVQKVSTRWKRLSQDAELWTNKQYQICTWNCPHSRTCKGGTTDEEAIQTFRDAPNLQNVWMQRPADSRVFRALWDNCPRLSKLYLHEAQKLSYSELKNLVENCPQIHTLQISNELLKCERFSKAVSRLQQLRVVYLEDISNIEIALRPLGDGCPQLAEVNFGCTTVDLDDLRYFLNAKRNTLKSVHIKWAMDGQGCVLPVLTVCADSLERLELYNFDIEHNEAQEAFTALGSLKNLHELKMYLRESPPPGVFALAFKAGGLPKLRLLDLQYGSGLTDDAVVAVSCGCPALRELCVSDCNRLTDAAFSKIHRLQHLETLDVSYCEGLGGALVPCLTRLPRLHTLHMGGLDCRKLQPGLASIVQLLGLRTLILDHALTTGVPFDKFPGNLLSLRKLSVSWCCGNRKDRKAVEGLTEQMPGLEIDNLNEEDEFGSYTESDESDTELREEENEENAGADDAGGAQDGGSGSDRDSDDDNSSSDSESDGGKLI